MRWFVTLVMFAVPVVAIIGAFLYLIVRTVFQSRVRELEIKERIAMIERGLVPAPEVDPPGFDRVMAQRDDIQRRKAPARHRRAGITMMGVGFGLMVLIGATADASTGLGVGGFLAILGLAFLLNSLFESGRDPAPPPRYVAPPVPGAAPPVPSPSEPRRD